MNEPPTVGFDFYRWDLISGAVENAGGERGNGDPEASSGGGGAAGEGGGASVDPTLTYTPKSDRLLLQNDSDPEGATLHIQSGETPTERGGTVLIEGDGGFIYTPPSIRFWGNDYFEYVVSDGQHSTKGRVRVTLESSRLELAKLDAGLSNGWTMLGEDGYRAFGRFAGSAGDVNGDGRDDLIVTALAPFDGTEGGVVYVVFGRAEITPQAMADLDQDAANGGFEITGFRPPFEQGQPVNGAGDLNGDGLDDLVISSLPSEDAALASVYVVFGRRETTPISLELVSDAARGLGARIEPPDDARERFGTSVAGAGDLNGDGYGDLVIGAPGAVRAHEIGNQIDEEVGVVYVLLGNDQLGDERILIEEAVGGLGNSRGFRVSGRQANLRVGSSVAAAGDVNADGLPDLVIGAPEELLDAWSVTVRGMAYVVFGNQDADSVDLGWIDREDELGKSKGFFIRGGERFGLGYAVAGAGYFNTDGIEDVVIGAPYFTTPNLNNVGSAYVAFGGTEALSLTVNPSFADAPNGFMAWGYPSSVWQGRSVAAGDFDGDGWSDVAMAGQPQSFLTYLLFGGKLPVLRLQLGGAREDCHEGGKLDDVAACFDGWDAKISEIFPTTSGDFDGDGFDDVYFGVTGANDGRGMAYIVLGWDSRDLVRERHLVASGGDGPDLISYRGGEILRFSGGHGIDTVVLDGPGFSWDLRAIEPTRLVSIERIDMSGPADYVVTLDEGTVRSLPSTRFDLPERLAKVLTVMGGEGDTLRVNLENFDEVGTFEGRRLFRRKGTSYAFAVDSAVAIR